MYSDIWQLSGKEPVCSAGDARDLGLIPGLGRSPGEGNGNPLQYSCLGNPMDKGAWRAALYRVEKESDTTEQLNTHTYIYLGSKIYVYICTLTFITDMISIVWM